MAALKVSGCWFCDVDLPDYPDLMFHYVEITIFVCRACRHKVRSGLLVPYPQVHKIPQKSYLVGEF